MPLAAENILYEISKATGAGTQYPHGSGVDAFCTLATHGPEKVRGQILGLGIQIYGESKNLAALNRIFVGLSSTMTPTYLASEIKRRMQEAMGAPARPVPPPITIQSLGRGTPPLPPTPKGGSTGMSPLGPFRRKP